MCNNKQCKCMVCTQVALVKQKEVGVYLSVEDIAQVDLQLVADSSSRSAAVVHDLDDTAILQDLLEAANESCLDRAVSSNHVKDKADRGSIHLQMLNAMVRKKTLLADQAPER